jgi:hypothetical protein
VITPATPLILMGKAYDGFKTARPFPPEIQNGWLTKVSRNTPDVPDEVLGGDLICAMSPPTARKAAGYESSLPKVRQAPPTSSLGGIQHYESTRVADIYSPKNRRRQ